MHNNLIVIHDNSIYDTIKHKIIYTYISTYDIDFCIYVCVCEYLSY